jgi:hypothetical protein
LIQTLSENGGIMHCSFCGKLAHATSRYCNGCGEILVNTNPLAETSPPHTPARLTGAAWAIALATTAITLGGLGIVFSTVSRIVSPPPWAANIPRNPGEIVPVAVPMIVFGTATVFLIVFMLIRLFIRLMNLPAAPAHSEKQRQPPIPQYRPSAVSAPPPQIQAPPMSMPSVTEHTTRNFDPIPSIEQRARE